ncbi:MAG: glycine cleavage system protein H [Gammaproteobacteria bacterium CG11_big_fil_rev_8_21_14_0_20_46_22]|nr:MAG: glycine cleavage system protein H [Gammaproteobacteria bacterium CG12_big_fil_rev_8_21_14_0_65_46_12]PIR10323.1 MAG: glycine cleavage system protein H [Gammaproteobacteria bacterium CG11_big_fil_rev_8_21_14_0_20_46_22]
MSHIPADLKYTQSHEWVRLEGNGLVVVGVTDHAQQLLGDLVFVELPEVDEDAQVGSEVCVLESVKAAADVYAPITGTITEVNEALNNTPEIINSDPYGEGWLFKMEITDESTLNDLLSAEAYQQHAASEQH